MNETRSCSEQTGGLGYLGMVKLNRESRPGLPEFGTQNLDKPHDFGAVGQRPFGLGRHPGHRPGRGPSTDSCGAGRRPRPGPGRAGRAGQTGGRWWRCRQGRQCRRGGGASPSAKVFKRYCSSREEMTATPPPMSAAALSSGKHGSAAAPRNRRRVQNRGAGEPGLRGGPVDPATQKADVWVRVSGFVLQGEAADDRTWRTGPVRAPARPLTCSRR